MYCRSFATDASGAPLTSGSVSSSSASQQSGASKLWRFTVILMKGVGLWFPASLFWISLLWGTPLIDLRTDEEIQDDENEARRLERFFDVEGLPEAEYLVAWAAKDEALAALVEKLLRSPRIADALLLTPDELDSASSRLADVSHGHSQLPTNEAEQLAAAVEVSHVLPPSADASISGSADDACSNPNKPWTPQLIIAHKGGSMLLASLVFKHVGKDKDREERWTCTAIRADLIALQGGDHIGEPVCDINGP